MKEFSKLNFSFSNCLSAFGHFVGLALKGLIKMNLDVVSTKKNLVTFEMFTHIVIFISCILKCFLQLHYKQKQPFVDVLQKKSDLKIFLNLMPRNNSFHYKDGVSKGKRS